MDVSRYRKRKAALAYLAYKHLFRTEEREKRYWVHPLVSSRLLKGAFCSLFIDLREDEVKFFNYFRMSIRSFDELSSRVGDEIRSQDTNMRLAIGPVEMLAVTLRYLGSGCTLADLHNSYRIGYSTLSQIVRKVCFALWNLLKTECFPPLTEDRWLEISSNFFEHANFPNCLGAVDGKHIRIIKPLRNGSTYFNYKNYFSLVMLAVADSNYNFLFVDIGSYGKDSDSYIFQNSTFYHKLENNELNIPAGKPLPGMNNSVMPYVFLGDVAFSLSQHVLRPYSGKLLSYKKRIYNYRLSRGRRYIECSFGILSNKWRILHRALNVKEDLALGIIKACAILHNYVLKRDGFNVEDMEVEESLLFARNEDKPFIAQGGRYLNEMRNVWADYFVSDIGKLSWQDNYA